MQYLDKLSAVARMNELGSRRLPFVFVVNYDGSKTIILSEEEIDPTSFQYSFNGVGNAP